MSLREVLAELRRKGFSLQKIRRVLRFLQREMGRRLADVLTALRHRVSLDEAGTLLAANAEQRLQPRAVLARRHPPAWLAESLAIAARCHFSPGELRYEYPKEIVPPGLTPSALTAADKAAAEALLADPGADNPPKHNA